MNIFRTKRILMNEADAPGNSAPVVAPVVPAPTAEPTAPALDVDALVARLSKVIDEKVDAKHNASFAKMRKDGQLKKDEQALPSTTPPAATAPTALSMDDVRALISRENAITRVAAENKLTDEQGKWMRDLVEATKPDDVLGYCKSFVTGLGIARPTDQPTAPVTAPVQPAPVGPPISDKGSPAPGGAVNWEREFAENPGFMSAAARAAMDAKHGIDKARRMRLDAVNAPGGQAERLRVTSK